MTRYTLAELARMVEQAQRLAQGLGVCPVCGSDLDQPGAADCPEDHGPQLLATDWVAVEAYA